jgi:hypothetical protein
MSENSSGESAEMAASEPRSSDTSADPSFADPSFDVEPAVPGGSQRHAASRTAADRDEADQYGVSHRAEASAAVVHNAELPASHLAADNTLGFASRDAESAPATSHRRAAENPARSAAARSISSRRYKDDLTSPAAPRATSPSPVPAAAEDYIPLMRGAPPPPASTHGALAPVTAATNTAAAIARADTAERKANAARRAQPPARAADDIEIHIGRIEVTAALPAAPRPAAAPASAARKSPSLDEFLKRRKGRIG